METRASAACQNRTVHIVNTQQLLNELYVAIELHIIHLIVAELYHFCKSLKMWIPVINVAFQDVLWKKKKNFNKP